MAFSSLFQTLVVALVVCVSATVAIPPGVLPFLGRQNEAPRPDMLDCSPSPNGKPLPAGCRETGEVTYRSEDRDVVEVVDGGKNTIVVEDEHAGTFVIRVPEQPVFKRRKCFFRHIYVAELDICVMPRYRYQPGSFKYPGLTAYY
ncbi:uncharacterized protein LOC123515458 [Portunus trituberculatus]|uniref:uncharacterized protein LOC123515458 n=1 Tax=Portunus trituberculatus TaxID=210409 RepID=UPI001E1CDF6D|nr:uncharacterized protein LOC123515458 [Portunus trituberculatus]